MIGWFIPLWKQFNFDYYINWNNKTTINMKFYVNFITKGPSVWIEVLNQRGLVKISTLHFFIKSWKSLWSGRLTISEILFHSWNCWFQFSSMRTFLAVFLQERDIERDISSQFSQSLSIIFKWVKGFGPLKMSMS